MDKVREVVVFGVPDEKLIAHLAMAIGRTNMF
jgi:hypothetical protein